MNQDMELLSKLARVERALHREQGRLHREGRFFADTSRGQGRILAMLKIKDGITTKELSYLLEIRVSSLNEMLAKMEKNGYIRRQPSDEDKRVSVIYITEKGRGEMGEPTDRPSVFDCFSEEEKQIFIGYLDRLLEALEARDASEDSGEHFRGYHDERWMEMMRGRMGEDWYEHVMAFHDGRMPFDRHERRRRPEHEFGNRKTDPD